MTGPVQIRPDAIEDIGALAEMMGGFITEAIGTAVRAQLAAERSKATTKISSRRKRAAGFVATLDFGRELVGSAGARAQPYGKAGRERSAAFMESIELRVEPVTIDHAHTALDALTRCRGGPAL